MKKFIAKTITMLTIVCLLVGSLELGALAETVSENEAEAQLRAKEEVVAVQQAEEIGLVTVSDGDEPEEEVPIFEYESAGSKKITIIGYNGTDTAVTIPGTIDGNTVVKVGGWAFANNKNITSVSIPASVTEIGTYAFKGCTGLSSVSIASGVKKVAEGAFRDCTALKGISLPGTVTEIGTDAFYGCIAMTSASIPASVTKLGSYAFRDCIALQSIAVPSGVTEIAVGTFRGCAKLKSVTLGSDVAKIDKYAFSNCTSLTDITIPKGIVVTDAFKGCTALSTITMLEGVTKLEANAFNGCYNLVKVTFPMSIEEIADTALVKNANLTIYGYLGTCAKTYARVQGINFVSLGVKPFPAVAISLNKTAVSVDEKDKVTLIASMATEDTTDTVVWSSSNEEVAKVSEAGVVTGVSKGTATITATTTLSGLKATCKVTVLRPSTKVTLNKKTVSIYRGDTYTLKETMTPEDTTDTVKWSSSDKGIATVKDGVVTAVDGGKATITVTTTSGETAECVVTVKERPATRIELDKESETLIKGKTVTLSATMSPKNTTDTITWKTSNKKVATVSKKGVVTAVNAGTATITAQASSGVTDTFVITVKVPSTKIALNKSSVSVYRFKTYTLTASMTPSNSTDKITWTTSDENIASVSNKGVVTANKRGTAVITATTESGKTAKCTVTVVVPATKVTLDRTEVTLNKGAKTTLKAAMEPEKSTDSLKWSSSNEKVAKVSSKGVVTAVGKGTATITVKSGSGQKAACKVTVKIPATKVKLNKTKASINQGKKLTLKATLTPKNSTDSVKWTSSNEKVAKVSSKGVVTAVGRGTATITAKTTSGKKATCRITVKVPAKKVTLNKTKLTLKKKGTFTLKATLTPKNSTDTVKWSSSNTKVATVSAKGKVTAVKKGTATITAKTTSGKKVTCKVTVK